MIIIPAVFEGYRTLKDRTLKITFETQELNSQELLGIAENVSEYGYLAFKKEPFREEEKRLIEAAETNFDDGFKTPSQRLRAVLYRLWEKDNQDIETFTLYYNSQMERLINHFKSKLD